MDSFLKKIELKTKKYINKLVSANRRTYHINQINNSFYFSKNPEILLLRHDRIGDLLVSTSFVRIIKNHFPDANIDMLLSNKNCSAKKCVEKYINHFWILEQKPLKYLKLLKKLNQKKYDLIIDLLDNPSTTSAIIIKYSNPVFALGIEKKNSQIYDYTVPMLDRYKTNIVERICNLLIAFGINPETLDLSLEYPTNPNVNEISTKFRFGLNLASGNYNRFLGIKNNENLIEHIIKSYPEAEIRIFYTKDFSSIVYDFALKYPKLIIGICDTFDQFANEVSKCNFLISPDTSIVHLASAFKIPSLIMYLISSNSSHSPWYPYKVNYKSILTQYETLQMLPSSEIKQAFDEAMIEFFAQFEFFA